MTSPFFLQPQNVQNMRKVDICAELLVLSGGWLLGSWLLTSGSTRGSYQEPAASSEQLQKREAVHFVGIAFNKYSRRASANALMLSTPCSNPAVS